MFCVCGVSGTCSVTKSLCAEQLVERLDRAVVAHRQLGRDVEEHDAHAHRLGEHADLRADVPVADDAQRLAAHLVAARRRPCATGPRAPRASDRRGGATSTTISARISSATLRVFENGALKTGTPRRLACVEVDLVGADAEARRRASSRRAFASTFAVTLRLAADAEHVHVLDALGELVLLERGRDAVSRWKPSAPNELVRARVDVLEQEDLDLGLGKRRRGHAGRETSRALR